MPYKRHTWDMEEAVAVFYLDDIIIFSKSPSKHVEHVRQELHLLSDSRVTLKPKNFWLTTDTLDYLGHNILPSKLETAIHISDTIHNLNEPRNMTELRSLFGFCNAFHRFIPSSSHIAGPLNKKLRKNQPQTSEYLLDEERNAMKTL